MAIKPEQSKAEAKANSRPKALTDEALAWLFIGGLVAFLLGIVGYAFYVW